MASGDIGPGKAVTTVRLRRRARPDTSSGTLGVFDPGAEVQVARMVSGETVLKISDWAELADGGFCWSGGLDQSPAVAALPQTPAGFAARAAAIAVKEWEFFGKNTQKLGGAHDHEGHTETEKGYYQRVGDYWAGGPSTPTGLNGLNTDVAWSAAFISFVMRSAGAGSRFAYSEGHSTYISKAIRDYAAKRADAGYWGFRLPDATPEIGDLVCWSRQPGIDYDKGQNGDFYKSHTDLVVAVGGGQVEVIGGNVGNSVTRRPLALDAQGHLVAAEVGGEKLFALMKCRIT